MLRKFFALLLVLLVFVLPASADVLWEPYENQYYSNADYRDFTYLGQTYFVPDGMTANIYKNPETGGLIITYAAGTRIYIGPSIEIDGELWGCGYVYGPNDIEGWVRLNRLQKEYSNADFLEDYAAQISYDPVILDTTELNGEIPSWTFPGSGIPQRTLTFTGEFVEYNEGKLECHTIYTDAEGHRWGLVGYYMGPTGWIYLEDLYTTQPPVYTYDQLNSTVTDTSPEEDPGGSSMVWIAIPVAVLVLGTAIAIVLLKKKSKKS